MGEQPLQPDRGGVVIGLGVPSQQVACMCRGHRAVAGHLSGLAAAVEQSALRHDDVDGRRRSESARACPVTRSTRVSAITWPRLRGSPAARALSAAETNAA